MISKFIREAADGISGEVSELGKVIIIEICSQSATTRNMEDMRTGISVD